MFPFIETARLPLLNRATQMAVAATKLAVQDAGLTEKDLSKMINPRFADYVKQKHAVSRNSAV